jgi:hypothetical protein
MEEPVPVLSDEVPESEICVSVLQHVPNNLLVGCSIITKIADKALWPTFVDSQKQFSRLVNADLLGIQHTCDERDRRIRQTLTQRERASLYGSCVTGSILIMHLILRESHLHLKINDRTYFTAINTDDERVPL